MKKRKNEEKGNDKHARTDAAPAGSGSTSLTGATALALLTQYGVTEEEAQALLHQRDVSDAEVEVALRANVPAIAAAFSAPTTAALVADPALKIAATSKPTLEATAARVRLVASATAKIEAIHGHGLAGAQVDVGVLQRVEWEVAPQIKMQARYDTSVATTFSSLLAYHHVRSPGRHGHRAAAPVDGAPGQPPAMTADGKRVKS